MTNLEKIMSGLSERNFDAVLLLSPENRRYATKLPTSSGAVLIHAGGGIFMTDFRYIEAAKAVEGFEVKMTDRQKSVPAIINEAIDRLGIRRLAFEDQEMTVATFSKFAKELKAELVPEDGFLKALMAVKDIPEKEKIIRAVKMADDAYLEVLPFIKAGVSERDIACELQYRMLKMGAEQMSFEPIVVSGERSSMPHGIPSDRKFRPGDFITMDFGCIADGYCSDMTRTVALGFATDEMKRIYGIVLEAQLAAIKKVRAGVAAADVDACARGIIEAEGYGDCFGHGTGHGIGLREHEAPTVSVVSGDILKAGNVISAEPGIYIDGKFGVRIEDLLFVTENGCEILTKAPKELLII
ncbi:MAG: aminopeptidase P family protein [Bacillota bacterium]|nr:aminopeptidase P family protein [Bacillota bacterium]